MKIFISHSSRDKWIARKLSEEILQLDCETFLDEKDIETGESIDESIHEHLSDSDDFLLLLTPDSVKSHWVLIELGGALALKKKIIIILLYLGANDIPQPITKYLARDINEVDKYYKEIRKRLTGKGVTTVKKEVAKKPPTRKPKNISVGDRVRLISTPQTNTRHEIGWNERKMNHLCGRDVTVSEVNYEVGYIHITEDNSETFWALEWMTIIDD